MLQSQELIAPAGDGRFTASGDFTEMETPDSLQGLIGARLDQLGTDERALLQDAAILGQSFTVEGLQALRDEPLDHLTAALQPLVSREVLSVNQDPRSPERGQYRFVQSIIREVAHDRISKANRLARHVRVAEYFESENDPELAGIVASHYLDALEVAPSDEERTELRPKAIGALLAAADRADALQSHPQVVRLSLRGIELTDDPAERGELYIRAARSEHAQLGDDAEAYAGSALAAFNEIGNQAGRLQAATTLARMLSDEGRANEGWAALLDVADDGETAIHADAYGALARAYMLDKQDGNSLLWADKALAIAERLDLIQVYADTLISKGTALGNSYRTRESVTLLEAGLALAREHQLSKERRRALQNLGVIGGSDRWFRPDLIEERLEDAYRLGEPRLIVETQLDEAWTDLWRFQWERVDEILADIDPDTLPSQTALIYWNVALSKMQLAGQPEEGERRFEALLEEQDIVGDAQATASDENTRTANAYLTGRFEEAFDRAMSTEQVGQYRVDLFWALLAAMQLTDPERLRQVVGAVEGSPFRGRVIDLFRHAGLGAIAAIEGHEFEATDHWTEALRLADEVMPVGVAAWFSAAAASSVGVDQPLGHERARLAYDAFTEVGAQTLLDLYADGVLAPDVEQEQAGSA
jgi:hypothetical protein